jgi:hypothetical protein
LQAAVSFAFLLGVYWAVLAALAVPRVMETRSMEWLLSGVLFTHAVFTCVFHTVADAQLRGAYRLWIGGVPRGSITFAAIAALRKQQEKDRDRRRHSTASLDKGAAAAKDDEQLPSFSLHGLVTLNDIQFGFPVCRGSLLLLDCCCR